MRIVVGVAGMQSSPREQDEGVVVCPVSGEVAHGGADLGFEFGRYTRAEIELVGNFQPEQAAIKVHGLGY